mmetsp:Transcript_25824/g.66463  ORF Transcript_25824/g.66463 Transcript_25824/m.66463 type:complete len:229 (-) Transcript_25824:1237-1923(-)
MYEWAMNHALSVDARAVVQGLASSDALRRPENAGMSADFFMSIAFRLLLPFIPPGRRSAICNIYATNICARNILRQHSSVAPQGNMRHSRAHSNLGHSLLRHRDPPPTLCWMPSPWCRPPGTADNVYMLTHMLVDAHALEYSDLERRRQGRCPARWALVRESRRRGCGRPEKQHRSKGPIAKELNATLQQLWESYVRTRDSAEGAVKLHDMDGVVIAISAFVAEVHVS